MARVGTAEIDVQINRAKVAAEVAGASRQIEAGFGTTARTVETQFAGAARAAAASFVAFKGGQFLNDAVQASSNLAEAQAKVGEVFGDTQGQVADFASGAAQAIGQSERQALEATGTFGNLFVAVGLADEQSAEFSITLTKLASDLASFNNVSVDDALLALRSGLVGETEPLRRFGVNLNEATLRAKALELGLDATTSTLDAGVKAQAAYALILEQTATAQGDFERTSDGLANKQRIAAAEFENAKAELGEGLLPVMKAATEVGINLTRVFSTLPGPLQVATVAATGLTAAGLLLGPSFVQAAIAIRGWQASQASAAPVAATTSRAVDGQTAALLRNQAAAKAAAAANAQAGFAGVSAAGGLRALGGSLGVASLALIGVEFAARPVQEFLADARVKTSDLTDEIERLNRVNADAAELLNTVDGGLQAVIDSVVERSKSDSIGDQFRDLWSNFGTGAELAEDSLAELDKLLAGRVPDDANAAAEAFRAVEEQLKAQGIETDNLLEQLPRFSDAIGGASGLNDAMAGSSRAAAEAIRLEEEAIRESIDAFDQRKAAEAQVFDSRLNTLAAVEDLRSAQAAARGDSDEYRRALENIADAERAVADAARDTQRAQEDLTEARERAAETLDDLRRSAEGSQISQERAQLRLEDAIDREREVLGDPRSTDRDKREATLARREAELALRDAQDSLADTTTELAEAERRGVEGSPEVVAAKERLADANDAQREAADRVRQAEADAIKVIEDAKARAVVASFELQEAILEQAEAEGELAEQQNGVNAGIGRQITVLERLAGTLDPNSPVRQRVQQFIEDLRELNAELFPQIPGMGPGVGPGMTGTTGAYAQPGSIAPGVGPGMTGTTGDYSAPRIVNNTFNVSGMGANDLEAYANKQERDAMGWGN